LVVLGLIFTILFKSTVNAKNGSLEPTLIKIEENQNLKSLAEQLKAQNLIKDERIFYWHGKSNIKKIKPGYYEIAAGSSINDIVGLLAQGKIKLVKVTIPEGWRVEQIGQRLDELKIVKYEDFVASAKPYEGSLFPNTHYFNPVMSAKEIINIMLEDYQGKISASNLEVSKEDLVIASIVEREAAGDFDRSIIAGIYKNRLKIGMRLESDPTVRYGKDENAIVNLDVTEIKNYKFWAPVKTSDLKSVISNFNTYLTDGLPPTPICNPGIKSIEATVHPEASDYLFFFHKDGQIYPSKTGEEHKAKTLKILGY